MSVFSLVFSALSAWNGQNFWIVNGMDERNAGTHYPACIRININIKMRYVSEWIYLKVIWVLFMELCLSFDSIFSLYINNTQFFAVVVVLVFLLFFGWGYVQLAKRKRNHVSTFWCTNVCMAKRFQCTKRAKKRHQMNIINVQQTV